MNKIQISDKIINKTRPKFAIIYNGQCYQKLPECNVIKDQNSNILAVFNLKRTEGHNEYKYNIWEVICKSATFILCYPPDSGWSQYLFEITKYITSKNNCTDEEAEIFFKNIYPDLWKEIEDLNNNINNLI